MNLPNMRADTPGCTHRIHLNNAGASLMPVPVVNALQNFLQLETEIGGYEAADLRKTELADFYASIAELLNAQPRNIAFAASATDAYSRVLYAFQWQSGDVILTTQNDYVSNQLAFLNLVHRVGIKLVRVADRPEGGLDLEDMERLLHLHKPKMVAVTHVPTNSGLVQPVAAVGAQIQAISSESWYLVDGCQSAGQLQLDVVDIGCDFFSATMRKFMRGPRGGGFLYVSDRALDAGLMPLIPDMRSANWTSPDTFTAVPDAKRFEYWEMSPSIVLGSAAAARYALTLGMPAIEERVCYLADRLRAGLIEVPGVRVLDKGEMLCGIVTCAKEDWDEKNIVAQLQAKNINARISTLGVAQIDFREKNVGWALRLSPHYYNTEEELDTVIEVLKTLN